MYQTYQMNRNKREKKLLGPQVEDELMQYILQKPIEVGEKIPNEFELAEMFGVGRSTIREAVKGLVSRGILEIRRGSGTFVVNTISPEQDLLGLGEVEDKYQLALDLFDVRLMIEPEIAALACRNATDEELEKLKKLCDETEELYESGFNHINKDIEFHSQIAVCSKNCVVKNLVPIINTTVMTFANMTHHMLKDETIDTHRAITESILKRDSVGARCAMIMHLTFNRRAIIEMIEKRDVKQEHAGSTAKDKK